MVSGWSTRRRGLVAVGVVAAVLAGTIDPASAHGSSKKTFTADIDGTTPGAAPSAYAGDADAQIVVVLRNTSSSQKLGSANVTVPAPFALVSSPDDTVAGGPVLELRNLALAPGASRSFTLTVDVTTCAAAPAAAFTVSAKQSNDYNGAGNDFTLMPIDLSVAVVGACTLAFVAQPADAELGDQITSAPLDPSAPPVAVEVLDASGTARATSSTAVVTLAASNPSIPAPPLGGTTSVAAVAGLATFSPGPTLAPSAFDYTLSASGAGVAASVPSTPFAIVDDGVNCPAGDACDGTATASQGNQSVSVTFGSGATDATLLVTIGSADAPPFECAGYPRKPGVLISQFTFVGDATDRVGTMSTTQPSKGKPLSSFQVCWAAPYPFKTRSGQMATVQGTKPGTGEPLYVGLLPDCKKYGPPTLPCICGRSLSKHTGKVTITVSTNGGDPWRY